MRRIYSIDTIRGACMWIMIFGHILEWWISFDSYWFKDWMFAFLESVGATGFLFVSGISTALAYKSSLIKTNNSTNFNLLTVRKAYFIRAIIILLIGFLYNTLFVIIWSGDLADIWTWYVLQTIGFSLIIAWPFLKMSKYIRIIVSIFVFAINMILLELLLPYEGQPNFFGFSFHILYNPSDQYIILTYFGIFLLGTVIGDILFEINIIEDQIKRKYKFKTKFIVPSLIIGTCVLIFGIFFQFPNFLFLGTLSSLTYSWGLILVVFSIFLAIEVFEVFKTTKSYKLLYYFSFYSFTIYLSHNLLYFLFPGQFNFIEILIIWVIGTALCGVLFRLMYHKLGSKASLKAVINILSYKLSMKIKLYDVLKFKNK
ncbi:MAG: heparan-alpha-glucosaminide N-acetyltransferase domain-containing protein [Promethearchaeota archaeon]